jgi:hypothetical protein
LGNAPLDREASHDAARLIGFGLLRVVYLLLGLLDLPLQVPERIFRFLLGFDVERGVVAQRALPGDGGGVEEHTGIGCACPAPAGSRP